MNRLVIIGNGFDMAHGLKTSYMDFINWYWEQRLSALLTENTSVSKDILCELKITNTKDFSNWFNSFLTHSLRDPLNGKWKYAPSEIISSIKDNTDDFSVTYSSFFERVLQSIETKGWVDIEYDYYQLLKQCIDNKDCELTVAGLNNQLSFLQEKLVEYLDTIEDIRSRKDIHDSIIDYFNPSDFSTEGKKKAVDSIGLDINDIDEVRFNFEECNKLIPEHIMLLSFNYTGTARMYRNFNLTHNYIVAP